MVKTRHTPTIQDLVRQYSEQSGTTAYGYAVAWGALKPWIGEITALADAGLDVAEDLRELHRQVREVNVLGDPRAA